MKLGASEKSRSKRGLTTVKHENRYHNAETAMTRCDYRFFFLPFDFLSACTATPTVLAVVPSIFAISVFSKPHCFRRLIFAFGRLLQYRSEAYPPNLGDSLQGF